MTGGNGGIGLGIAEALAQVGVNVCIWGRNEEKNNNAVQHLLEYGTKVSAQKCDVSQEDEVEACFADCLSNFGRVDSCFANAGIADYGPNFFNEMKTANWKRILSVNLDGVFYTLRAASRHMVERAKNGDPGGSLIATSSLGASMGMPKQENYAASKGAIISLMRSLAVEFGRFGVTANTLLPGFIETPNFPIIDVAKKRFFPRIPMGRGGKPEDLGAISIYLASDASSYHTGDCFTIDGGFSLSF